jgi:hypothetical protein
MDYNKLNIKEITNEINKTKNGKKKKLLEKLLEFKIIDNLYDNSNNQDENEILDDLINLNNQEDDYDIKEDIDERTNLILESHNKDIISNKFQERLNIELEFRKEGFQKNINKPFYDNQEKYTRNNSFDIPSLRRNKSLNN